MKHFIDIERLKIGVNDREWKPTDIVVVQEKMDGSNASFTFDPETKTLKAFSRRMELTPENTLQGFYNWVEFRNLDIRITSVAESHPEYVFFGEWGVNNKVQYDPAYLKKFYFYDIYDTKNEVYLPQNDVKEYARLMGLQYVNTLYEGEFKDWDNMRQFMGKSELAIEEGEGVVVKNQTLLNSPRNNFYLKLVCDSFSEVQKIKTPKTAEEVAAEQRAREICQSIVTERRVEKMLNNLRDDGILVDPVDAKQMGVIAKNLPKRIWEDITKEEPETVAAGLAASEKFGKICSNETLQLAKKIVLQN